MVGEEAGGENFPHLWLPPTRVVEGCTSTAGYPDGRHHALVKAAEARLACQMGAVEIALMPDPDAADDNAVLAEAVAVREALPHPARLLLCVDPKRHNLKYLAASGVDGFVISGWGKIESPIPVVRIIEDAPVGSVNTMSGVDGAGTDPEGGEAGAQSEGDGLGGTASIRREGTQPLSERIVYLREE